MEYKRFNYKNHILKKIVIPKLRNDIEIVNDNIKYNFPKENEAKFPLIVLNINDAPYIRDIGQNEMLSNITVSISVLSEYQSDCMDLEFDTTTCMLELGFTKIESTMPFKNEIYDKFEIDTLYRIRYNSLNFALEKAI